jgi:anti-sigma factor RsiW
MGRFLDGELLPEDARLVEGHVRDCSGCRAELQALRALSASLEAVAAPPVPAGLADEIMRRVRGQQARSLRNPGILEFWKPWPVAMRWSAAGVAAAACVIGVILGSTMSRPASRTGVDTAWVEFSTGSAIASAHLEATR